MNEIIKRPLNLIGYDFVSKNYLPEGKDEYHLRNIQNKSGINYRTLTAYEIEVLVRNNNTSDDWNKINVSDEFNPELVKNCKFYGLVRIGKLETIAVEYHNVRLPVGLYNSTIISCDFGDNVVVNNVNYLSHYIIGNEVMIANVHELHITDHAKFGNGIIKDGEDESIRIWVEVCNENGGRKIIPFNGMLPGDAYLWAKFRDDLDLMQKFKDFTEKKFDKQRGYYGKVGDRTVIKNTSIMKDVWIGSDAYIKGANKLKNLTINSSAEAPSQIGEGCELVNGIVGYGCRIFYGVKAVRFVMASHSQLKYGARLINSFLGNNSTISCCEVLNSLIFPGHEQHHNNSFLCAAMVMGQSNIAAGATIGSNHNSRAADGEMVTARGFWPGLCVSLKHNSKFASFTLLAKGDYPAELNIPIPFSLVSNDEANDRLIVMPAYWFLYNLYALARNSDKYIDRDKRTKKIQRIEYDFLAPDTINEIFSSLKILNVENSTDPNVSIKVDGFENSNRVVELIKVKEAYHVFVNLIKYYSAIQFINYIDEHNIKSFDEFIQAMPAKPERTKWLNIGGQLMPELAFKSFLNQIKSGEIHNWDQVHEFYQLSGKLYVEQKVQHAYASILEILQLKSGALDKKQFRSLLDESLDTKEWMVKNIYESRAKDYQNEFRKMVYDNEAEMEQVIGTLDDNNFIDQQKKEFLQLKKIVAKTIKEFSL
jgi:Nucleoside-diphosphate-sugar pyrophosphorylase involved in lipopolysaccharide biosynthesis/translation initiation factor 2B, gamma/epsilon subunits (eIF-2Bgamma/eIF-2Bepsilon)